MDKENKIQILFGKYLDKTLNEEELVQLNSILCQKDQQEDFDELLRGYFQDDLKNTPELELKGEAVQSRAWEKIEKNIL